MRIALILFVYNDLPFLRATLPYEKKWADQVCILDLGSTDGTEAFCQRYLDRGDRYVRRPVNTVPELGFAEAANAASALSDCDWLFVSSADQMLSLDSVARIHAVVRGTRAPVLSMSVANINPEPGDTPAEFERSFDRPPVLQREATRRLVKRDSGIVWRGYIHEELFKGEDNAASVTQPSGLTMLHFGGWMNNHIRRPRYHWMFRNALANVALQAGTNRWWYDVYCVENDRIIAEDGRRYEEYVASTGLR